MDGFALGLGVFATISQVVLMREGLCVVGGNELAVVLGFAAWLTGVGTGAGVAALLSRGRRWLGLLVSVPVATGLATAALVLLRLHRGLLDIPDGTDPSLMQIAAVIGIGLGTGGMCAGYLFTFAARTLPASRNDDAPVSRLYAMESVGALVGGLLFAFVLASRVPHITALGLAGSTLFFLTGLCLKKTGAHQSRHDGPTERRPLSKAGMLTRKPAVATMLLAIAGVTAALVSGAGWDQRLMHRAFDTPSQGTLVDVRESPYGRLALMQLGEEHALLVDGRIRYAFPDPWERPVPIHLALTQHPRPKSVLLLGGGIPDRLDAVLAHHPDKVVITYLDHQAHEMALPHLPPTTRSRLEDPRVQVVLDDGRRYLAHTLEKFDVVVVSAPPPLSAGGNRYHTRELYQLVARALTPGGVITVTAPGGANVLAPEAARAAATSLATVRSVFDHVALAPGLETLIHAAQTAGVVTEDPDVLAARYRQRQIDTRSFSWRRFESIYVKDRIAALTAQLSKWPRTINTDAAPSVFLANLQLWERSLGDTTAAARDTLTGHIERSAPWWLGAALLLTILGWTPLVRRRSTSVAPALTCIATTGAAGMAVEVLVLYAYQATQGTLYVGIAILTALFMAGLAAGALASRRYLLRNIERGALFADGAMIVLLVTTSPTLSLAHLSPAVPAIWGLIAGVVTGGAFPVFLQLAAHRRNERTSAAAIEAADHLGAALGALVTGLVWLPVYGMTCTCLFFAAVKTAAWVGPLWWFKRARG